jgi:cysteinyl-tRNA synthetase
LRGSLDGVLRQQIDARAQAKAAKDFATADAIRDSLKDLGVSLEDGADGVRWSI